MSTLLIEPTEIPTSIEFPGSGILSDDQFLEFCRKNPDSHIEREANGDITISAPSGAETSRRNAEFTTALGNWTRSHGGVVLDSSGGFRLPDSAIRAPDVSWISQEHWDAISIDEREGFPKLVPEFVVEIVSPTDSVPKQFAKMEAYASNGVQLGWLIIPAKREVQIFRPGAANPEILTDVESLRADEAVLPGFEMDFSRIW